MATIINVTNISRHTHTIISDLIWLHSSTNSLEKTYQINGNVFQCAFAISHICVCLFPASINFLSSIEYNYFPFNLKVSRNSGFYWELFPCHISHIICKFGFTKLALFTFSLHFTNFIFC